jgi:hypothetical protein
MTRSAAGPNKIMNKKIITIFGTSKDSDQTVTKCNGLKIPAATSFVAGGEYQIGAGRKQ